LRRSTGVAVLALSACGFPLTQVVIRRWGRGGAVAVEAVCAGLLLRDASMIAAGAPARLRPGPATLLWSELGAAAAACLTGLPRAFGVRDDGAVAWGTGPTEIARRAAIATLFSLHTWRFAIYLQPSHGRRK
jgi:hypothetical protein